MAHKRFLFVNRRAPYGTGYAAEMLEAVLIAAAFDQSVHLAFLDDGVFQGADGGNQGSSGQGWHLHSRLRAYPTGQPLLRPSNHTTRSRVRTKGD